MITLLGIIFGLLFAVIAARKGFYESWVILVNLVLAVYLGIFAGTWLADFPGVRNLPYALPGSVLGVAVLAFLIFCSITYVYFTSQFYIPFGRLLDFLGAGIVGFLSGFLVWSFISILLCPSLESMEIPVVSQLNIDRQACSSNIGYLGWWTGIVHTFTASDDSPQNTTAAISRLTDEMKQQVAEDLPESLNPPPEPEPEPPSPNKPNKPNKPADANQPPEPNQPPSPNSPPESNKPSFPSTPAELNIPDSNNHK